MTSPLQPSPTNEQGNADQTVPSLGGTIVSLHIAPSARVPMTSIASAHLVPGRGIVGDRFYLRRGTDAAYDQVTCDVTLVEQEALETMRSRNPPLDPGASGRRNIVVRGCDLALLVGRTFRIGKVTLRGLAPRNTGEVFAQSATPAERSAQATSCVVLPPRAHLRAAVVMEETISVGDRIEVLPGTPLNHVPAIHLTRGFPMLTPREDKANTLKRSRGSGSVSFHPKAGSSKRQKERAKTG